LIKRYRKTFLLASLILILLTTAGCQSVGSIELGQVIYNGLIVDSYEGNANVAIELIPDPDAKLTPEQANLLTVMHAMTFNITEIKQQDRQHASMKGSFVYSKGSIPFELFTIDGETIIQIEGAKKPIVMKDGVTGMNNMTEALPIPESVKQGFRSQSHDVLLRIGQYLLNKADNPQHISVEPVTETINGMVLGLNKVHVEMSGEEWKEWLKSLIFGVLSDEAGMKELVGQLYDLIEPQLSKETGSTDEAKSASALDGIFADKEMAVNLLTSIFQNMLTRTALAVDGEPESSTTTGPQAGPLSEISSLALDLEVDSGMHVRKSKADFSLTPSEPGKDGILETHVVILSEKWNINQPVQADTPVSKDWFQYSSETRPGELMSFFKEGTPIYMLLKDDLHRNRETIRMPVGEAGEFTDGLHPYISGGSTLVPIRFVVEKLNANIRWDGETKEVTVNDSRTQTTIKLTVGSDQASVNGKPVTLETPAELTDNSTFVPVRFIAESLGAKVEWDNDTRSVIITQEQ
jgi:hypothetical protein